MKKEVLVFIFLVLINWASASTISGKVYNDLNGDSLINNDPILSNSTIVLFDFEDFNEITTTTDENGYYSFDVKPGRYMILERLENEIFTYPEFGFYYLIIKDNEIINDNDFGNFKLGKIYGYVYNKNNEPVNKVKVTLSNNFTYLTNEFGYYEFKDLEAGEYFVSIQNEVVKVIITSGSFSENNFDIDYIDNNNLEEKSWVENLYDLFS